MRAKVTGLMMVLLLFAPCAGKLYAYQGARQGKDPELCWRFVTGGKILFKPALDHRGVVYIVSDDRHLYAVLPQGRVEWSFKIDSKPSTSPLVSYSGTVYIGSESGVLYAVAPNGILRWKFQTDSGACLNPCLGSDGTVYLPTRAGVLFALSFAGREKWRFQIKAGISSGPSLGAGDIIYFGSDDRRLHALGPTGEKKWEAKISGIAGTPAIGDDGTLYVNSFGIQAISPDGKVLWNYAIPAQTADPVIGFDGAIIAGAQNARLYAINPEGKKIWDLYIGEAIQSAAAVAEDYTILVGTVDNHLYAVSTHGKLLWGFSAKRSVRVPTIDRRGTLYFGSDDWILYALKGEHGGPADTAWPLYLHDYQQTGRFSGLKDLSGSAFLILREMAYSDSADMKKAALDDIELYLLGHRYLAVHVQSLERILGHLVNEGLTLREYRQGVLVNKYPAVRTRSCELLGSLATTGARNILLELLKHERDPALKYAAVVSLGRIGTDADGEAVKTICFELERGAGRAGGVGEPFIIAALDALALIVSRNRELPDPAVYGSMVRVACGNYSNRVRRHALHILRSLDREARPEGIK